MGICLQVIYENGVFRPLRPVQLAEHSRFIMTIDPEPPAEDSILDDPTAS